MTPQVSALPVPKDPLASRVLVLTGRADKMPVLEPSYVKFILRQNDHNCHWVQVKRLSKTKTGIHFSSLRDAEKARQIPQSHFPDVQISYGFDPATGLKELESTINNWIAPGGELPDTTYFRFVCGVTLAASLVSCCLVMIHWYCKP